MTVTHDGSLTQKVPGQKFQRHHSVVREMEQINRVDDLLGRHMQVDYTEIVLQSVSDERHAAVRR